VGDKARIPSAITAGNGVRKNFETERKQNKAVIPQISGMRRIDISLGPKSATLSFDSHKNPMGAFCWYTRGSVANPQKSIFIKLMHKYISSIHNERLWKK
jgi:hypothetical protein